MVENLCNGNHFNSTIAKIKIIRKVSNFLRIKSCYPIVKIIIPLIVMIVPITLFNVTASPPKIIPISAPNKGDVKAIGITLPSDAPFIAI